MLAVQAVGLHRRGGRVGDGLAARGRHLEGAGGVADHGVDRHLHAPGLGQGGVARRAHGRAGDHEGQVALLELLEAAQGVDGREHGPAAEQELVDGEGQPRVQVVRVEEGDDRRVLGQLGRGVGERDDLEASAELLQEDVAGAGLVRRGRQLGGDGQGRDEHEAGLGEARDGRDELRDIVLEEALAPRVEEGQGAQRVRLARGEAEVGRAVLGARAAQAVALGAALRLGVGLGVGDGHADAALRRARVLAQQGLGPAGVGLEVGRELGLAAAREELDLHRLAHPGGQAARGLGQRVKPVLGEVGPPAEPAGDEVGEDGGREDRGGGEGDLGAVHGGLSGARRRGCRGRVRPGRRW